MFVQPFEWFMTQGCSMSAHCNMDHGIGRSARIRGTTAGRCREHIRSERNSEPPILSGALREVWWLYGPCQEPFVDLFHGGCMYCSWPSRSGSPDDTTVCNMLCRHNSDILLSSTHGSWSPTFVRTLVTREGKSKPETSWSTRSESLCMASSIRVLKSRRFWHVFWDGVLHLKDCWLNESTFWFPQFALERGVMRTVFYNFIYSKALFHELFRCMVYTNCYCLVRV